jgi:glycosyltransferase involved in cell wall biosynthesis
MTVRSYIKVLLVAAFNAPFIQDDCSTIDKHFILKKRIGHGITAIIKIVFSALTSDVVFCWFASVYAFVGVFVGNLLNLKTIVVVGGVDAAKDESLDYGIWLKPWKAKLARYVFKNATHILVVDTSLKDEAIRLAEYDGSNIKYIPTGYDSEFWKPLAEKESIVLTVAVANDERTFRRKGIDTLIEAAKLIPEVNFIVIGVDEKLALSNRPPLNVEFVPKIPREKLLSYYQHAKVYCQPSRREGLPNALCEAMLCGCFPVASEVNGNPTALGDTGILVPPSNPEILAKAILNGLSIGVQDSQRARMRIVSLFPKSKRESELIKLILGENK